jgi:hypothetical protein
MAQDTESAPKGYANQMYISEQDGIKIYIKAIEKIRSNIQGIMDMEKRMMQIKNAKGKGLSNESTELKYSITEIYLKTKTIIEEFMRGFSVTHDIESQAIMSLLHRLFFSVLESLNLAYITNKVEYCSNALARLDQVESLFGQMLQPEKK